MAQEIMEHLILFPHKIVHTFPRKIRILLLKIKKQQIIARRRNLQRKLGCFFINFFDCEFARQYFLHKSSSRKLLIDMHLSLVLDLIIVLILFLLDLLFHFKKRLLQHEPCDRL